MQHKDYDAAAALLQSASRIDHHILHGSLAEFTVVRCCMIHEWIQVD